MIGILVLVAARVLGVLCALSITATSYRAYRGTSEETFLFATGGFACLSLGLGVESVLLRATHLGLREIHTVESAVFAVGFVILLYSLRGRS